MWVAGRAGLVVGPERILWRASVARRVWEAAGSASWGWLWRACENFRKEAGELVAGAERWPSVGH